MNQPVSLIYCPDKSQHTNHIDENFGSTSFTYKRCPKCNDKDIIGEVNPLNPKNGFYCLREDNKWGKDRIDPIFIDSKGAYSSGYIQYLQVFIETFLERTLSVLDTGDITEYAKTIPHITALHLHACKLKPKEVEEQVLWRNLIDKIKNVVAIDQKNAYDHYKWGTIHLNTLKGDIVVSKRDYDVIQNLKYVRIAYKEFCKK